MNSNGFVVFIFALFLAVGSWMTYQSWNGAVYVFVDDGESRSPAAVKQNMDFSKLKGSELSIASQKRVLSEARVVRKGESVGLELGHFITRRENGKRAFACHLYQKVQLKFIAVGVAENGESPVMQVEGDCKIGDSVSRISPIWIPTDLILSERPGNMELNFNEPHRVSFRFDHIGSDWPLNWSLSSVTLKSRGETLQLHIGNQEILSLLDKPIHVSFDFQRATASQ